MRIQHSMEHRFKSAPSSTYSTEVKNKRHGYTIHIDVEPGSTLDIERKGQVCVQVQCSRVM